MSAKGREKVLSPRIDDRSPVNRQGWSLLALAAAQDNVCLSKSKRVFAHASIIDFHLRDPVCNSRIYGTLVYSVYSLKGKLHVANFLRWEIVSKPKAKYYCEHATFPSHFYPTPSINFGYYHGIINFFRFEYRWVVQGLKFNEKRKTLQTVTY